MSAAQNRKLRSSLPCALAVALLGSPCPVHSAELKPEAARGFERYVWITEQRMQRELAPGGAFLWEDGLAEPQHGAVHEQIQRGEVALSRLETLDRGGRISTPGALIHHWVGTIFIPGVSLSRVLAVVEDYDHHADYYAPDVAQAKTIARDGENFKVHYRLRKRKVITIILDTDYDVHRHQLDAKRAYSNSYSTRIVQVENAGEPGEHDLPPGNDGGYLWRLNSYWRFFDSGSGVYVQCEAISLTRDIPEGLNWLAGPFVESVPRESLEFTLRATRDAAMRGIASNWK